MEQKKLNTNADIVRFDDRLVYDASYRLSARAIKTICFIASRYIDPLDNDIPRPIFVPLSEIANALSDGRSGKKSSSLYASISSLCQELVHAKIKFKSNVQVEGKDLDGYVSWCSDAVPTIKKGVKGISFGFGVYMSQFLIGLSRYVAVYRPELNRLNSTYSIRIFQILKGILNKRKKYRKVFTKVYSIEEFRYMLDIGDKYGTFKTFNDKVLKPAVKEINENTSVYIIELKKMRRFGRKISHLEFTFTENKAGKKLSADPSSFPTYEPTAEDLASLSYAETRAYNLLIDFSILPGIAFKQILPEISGSESIGFEDYFIAAALDHFRSTARNQQDQIIAAKTFVTWWTKLRVFDTTSDAWIKINELVVAGRKRLSNEDPEAFDNRLYARELTHEQFKIWWKDQRSNKVEEPDPKNIKLDDGFEDAQELLKKFALEGFEMG